MPAPRFHLPDPLDRASLGTEIDLPDAVAHHALRVLRLDAGDAIALFDGRGGEYAATITQADRRGARARVDTYDPVEREPAHPVTLVLAVLAADPMEFALRRAVELGAGALVPVLAARSQGLPGDRAEKRVARWQQVAIAACEQCGRNRVPVVAPVTPFGQWLDARAGVAAPAVLLGPGAARSLAASALTTLPGAVAVGPEGGWTEAEIAAALGAGIEVVHLGPRILRAETAALAALATLNAVAGDAR